jgi:hypothetical protein
LAGRSAFTATSHGYVSTRLKLLSLAGQTVQFRWRVGTDRSNGAYGWFLDDVSVNVCPTLPVVAFNNANYSVNENVGTGIATITVSRSASSTGAVSVNYAATAGSATAGSDFNATSGTLNWTDGDMTDKTFTVAIHDDTTYEGNETINLALSSPNGAILGTTDTAMLTILDNEIYPVVAFSNASYTVAESIGTATITVSRSVSSNGPVSVNYQTYNGTATSGQDFITTGGTLNWADGDMADKSFTVTILDDATYENNETVSLALSSPSGAILGTTNGATLTITDNDTASSGGGGGAIGWPFLLLGLGLLPLRRRLRITT